MASRTRSKYVSVPNDFRSLVNEQSAGALAAQIRLAIEILNGSWQGNCGAVVHILEELLADDAG